MEEHADDEKGKFVSLEQMKSLNSKQEVPKLEPCGTVYIGFHDEKSEQPLVFNIKEEDSRISKKHFSTSSSGDKRRTQEIMGRSASWWATFTFSLCLFSLKFSKPLLQPQGPNSLWFAIVGMFSFILLVSAATVMLFVGARFTQMQITVMLIAFLTLLLA